ncbi:MAG TPA: hypothetical protein ENH85_02795 [Candidatus Scalindua sp.]|nr:hypothetical protein [Candidatus Scalindua sp.]
MDILLIIGATILIGGLVWLVSKNKKLVAGTMVASALAASALNPAPIPTITAPENNGYKIGIKNYISTYAADITQEGSLRYEDKQGYIEFTPVSFKAGNRTITTNQVLKAQDQLKWEGIFEGIDIGINEGQRVWQKLIIANSTTVLDLIPTGATEVEIKFLVETNQIIDGWDKSSDFEIIDKVRLGDFSYIEQPVVWDSYSEDVLVTTTDDGEEIYETLTNRQDVRGVFSKQGNQLYFTKYIPSDFLRNAQFPVYTDVDVTYGTSQEFDADEVGMVFVSELDIDKFVVCYYDFDNNDTDCRAGTVLGTTITYGTKKNIDDTPTITNPGKVVCVAKLETDKFLTVWKGGSNTLEAVVATTTGTTINFNPADIDTGFSDNTLGAVATSGNDVCIPLDDNKVAVGYHVGTFSGSSFIATVPSGSGGSTITTGTEVDFGAAGDTRYLAVCKLSTDEGTFAISFEDQGDSDQGKIIIATSTGTTINGFTTPISFATTPDNEVITHCEGLGTDKAVVTWRDQVPTPDDLNARIFTIDDQEVVTFGTEVTLEGSPVDGQLSRSIDSSRFLTVYNDQDSTDDGKSVLSSFSGTTITNGSSETWESGAVSGVLQDHGLSLALISPNKVIICYQLDSGTDDPGHCIIGDVTAVAAAARRIWHTTP